MNHFFRAFKYSIQGIRSCYKSEVAFRQEVHVIIILFPISFFISSDVYDFLWLNLGFFLILSTELINTSIENTIDKTIPQKSKRAGMAKDQGSAAVFFALCFTGITWLSIIYKNFLHQFFFVVADIVTQRISSLNLQVPSVSDEQKIKLAEIKNQFEKELSTYNKKELV
jgi:diacylglycerol kinase (ATP)